MFTTKRSIFLATLFPSFAQFSCGVAVKTVNEQQHWANYYQQHLTLGARLIEAKPTQTVERSQDHYIVQQYYYDTKTLVSRRFYRDAALQVPDGPTISYTDTGIKIMEGNYVNGLLEGEVLGYNREKGYLSAKSTYKADKLEGIATYYNTKGSVIETKQYRSNNLDGEMITYDSIGRIVRTQLYSNGQLVSVEPKFTIEQSGPLDESAPAFPCDPSLAASNNCSERSLMVYLAQNIRYPSQARELNIQGKASVTFVVDKDGSIKDIQVLRGHCNAIRDECIRVVSNMPKWTPGHVNGKPLKVRYTLPISFKLE